MIRIDCKEATSQPQDAWRNNLITYKSEEWLQYHQRVSQWEIDQYARLF